MKLGASTIAHRKLPLTLELLESYRAADIESLELCDYHPNFAYGDRNFAAGVTEALRDLQLHLNSIHIHLRNRDPSCDLASTDAAQHERSVAAHRQTVDFAHSLGGCILVTHDIEEAALLADRILVLGSDRPAGLTRDLEVPFPRPRGRALTRDPAFGDLVDGVEAIL